MRWVVKVIRFLLSDLLGGVLMGGVVGVGRVLFFVF